MKTNPTEFTWLQPTEREDDTPLDLSEIRGNNVYISPLGDDSYTLVFTATLQAGATPNYVLPISQMEIAEGQYSLVVTAIDTLDRESDFSLPIEFEVVLARPKPPTGLSAS